MTKVSPALFEVVLEALLDQPQAHFGQPGALLFGERSGDPGQGLALPEVDGLGQQPPALVVLADRAGLRGVGRELLRAVHVQGERRDVQLVAVAQRHQDLGGGAVLFQGLPEPPRVGAQARQGGVRGIFAPDRGDEVVGGRRPSGAQQQGGEQCLLLRRPGGENGLAPMCAHGSEHAEPDLRPHGPCFLSPHRRWRLWNGPV